MDHDELLGRVRALRAKGSSPKEIARALGIKPAMAASAVRALATTEDARAEARETVECWVSPGWSEGLAFDGHTDWPDVEVSGSGLVNVLVARKERGSKARVCGYLVDVYCLGVKDVLGPQVVNARELSEFSAMFFSAYQARPLAVPLTLAQNLVFGAVEYARELGFEPAGDFAEVKGHLGSWTGPSAIRFGLDGKPYFIAGPHDDPARVLAVLEKSVGQGNFHYLAGV